MTIALDPIQYWCLLIMMGGLPIMLFLMWKYDRTQQAINDLAFQMQDLAENTRIISSLEPIED